METIHPKRIESALETLWEAYRGSDKMRACLLNLIIYSGSTGQRLYLEKIAKNVIMKFPSRVFLIVHDRKRREVEPETAVSLLTPEKGRICVPCDMIRITVSDQSVACVPFIILPHLFSDLPIHMIEADDPVKAGTVSGRLERLACRLVFDAEGAGDLAGFAKTVLQKQKETGVDVADLHWGRIEGWRRLFANVFRPPDDLSHLNSGADIRIHYCATGTTSPYERTQAIYLRTWLACTLKWHWVRMKREKGGPCFVYEVDSRPVHVRFLPLVTDSVQPGHILRVEIETQTGVRYHFERDEVIKHRITINRGTEDRCYLPTLFMLDRELYGQAFIKEICYRGTSRHYTDMLEELVRRDGK